MFRQQILSAAEFEFASAGFDKTKVADIARTADVSLATVYKIFSGKDEIWDVLNRQRVDEFIAAGLRATESVASPLERLLAALRALVTYFVEHPNYLHLHIKEGLSWATAGEQWGRGNQRDAWRIGITHIADLAAEAVAAGEAPAMRPSILAGLTVSALQVWLTDWVRSDQDRPPSQLIAELDQYMRRLVSTTTASPSTVAGSGES
ncbi:regulatory protein TetR [Mycolicibacterium rhodesiae JS60]|nr:regulatory protein TetR [Mycolicibacterium rhodesiae JS60]